GDPMAPPTAPSFTKRIGNRTCPPARARPRLRAQRPVLHAAEGLQLERRDPDLPEVVAEPLRLDHVRGATRCAERLECRDRAERGLAVDEQSPLTVLRGQRQRLPLGVVLELNHVDAADPDSPLRLAAADGL